MLTGVDQHIEKKTLDDYYGYIRSAYEAERPFDFRKHSNKNISALRKHCLKLKQQAEAEALAGKSTP